MRASSTSVTPMADVRMINAGSLVGFVAESTEAHDWFDEYVEAEGWEYLSPVLYVDHCNAMRIVDDLHDYGLSVTV
jgi:hypothetical protein